MIEQAGVLIGAGGVVYIVICTIVATKAVETGRSGGGYFLLSFLLSPLVGFMTLTLSILAKIELAHRSRSRPPSVSDETSTRMRRTDLTWDCPKCREKNPNSTYTCGKCGYSLK